MKTKILFILKRRDDYHPEKHNPKGLSTGLYNSAHFMEQMLIELGIHAEMEIAIDNNCIDRLVTKHRPTHVIIEALWVVPAKFAVLTKLHPKVKWIIRLHSEMPFMAGEGMAMNWLGDYATYPQIVIGVNAPRMHNEVSMYLRMIMGWTKEETTQRVVYLPNYYPQHYKTKEFNYNKHHVDIGIFGAVRPLKNHLSQVFAALKFANNICKKVHIHINGGRIEMKGDSIMNNLRDLFQQLSDTGNKLITHEWAPRENFLEICANMDIGMQCNFSETFNIVSADLISQGVPVLTCSEIPWASSLFNAKPTDTDDMADVLERIYKSPSINVLENKENLTKYTTDTADIWGFYFTRS